MSGVLYVMMVVGLVEGKEMSGRELDGGLLF